MVYIIWNHSSMDNWEYVNIVSKGWKKSFSCIARFGSVKFLDEGW